MANEHLRQQLANLYRLQEHDRELLSFHQRLIEIPRHIEKLELSVTKFKTDISTKTDELAEIEKSLQTMNVELETNGEQREKFRNEQREVTSNEAYAALENQIEFLDQKDAETEVQILELMEKVDLMKEELDKLNDEVASEDKIKSKKTAEFREEQKVLKADIDKRIKQRSQFLPKIDKTLGTQYQRWIEKNKGDFVALGKNGTCGSCRLTIQPQSLKEAQKYEKLVYCSNCKRVLYVEPLTTDEPYP
ncbi:hypothetical protein C6497_14255 [Candidatus Poribacteria bacterium]|nr:MAG: hypothetical protein C6497_14255 [Candidatus Poribacteria bacterium]